MTVTAVVEKEEGFVALDWPADVSAKLVEVVDGARLPRGIQDEGVASRSVFCRYS
jgi:hypothetical protein